MCWQEKIGNDLCLENGTSKGTEIAENNWMVQRKLLSWKVGWSQMLTGQDRSFDLILVAMTRQNDVFSGKISLHLMKTNLPIVVLWIGVSKGIIQGAYCRNTGSKKRVEIGLEDFKSCPRNDKRVESMETRIVVEIWVHHHPSDLSLFYADKLMSCDLSHLPTPS